MKFEIVGDLIRVRTRGEACEREEEIWQDEGNMGIHSNSLFTYS